MQWIWPLLAAPLVGSFLGVLITRLPAGRPVGLARSSCDHCHTPLSAPDLVPVLSYAALKGRCRHCQAAIPPFHLHVELAAILIPASAALAGLAGPDLWLASLFGWTLLALSWIDIDTMLLPDALTLPLIPAGLAAAWWRDPAPFFDQQSLRDHALAAALGYTLLRAVALAYRRLRHRDGMGGGDPKLLAALGAWIGLADLPTVLLGAALAGLAWALIQRLRGTPMTAATAIPFGPFLALSGWLVLLQAWRDATG